MIQTKMDRVGECYEGLYGSIVFQERTRERVDWICAHAHGGEILDIGCSQGIVGLLLARQDRRVLAMDIDPEVISYAEERIAREEPRVRENVRYVCADFMEHDFGSRTFDCILCTEILEHLEDPGALLEKASSLLRPGGEILVMVPFGINPHPDHKRTYYYLELLHIVEEHFQPAEAGFVMGWVAIRGVRKEDGTSGIEMDEAFMEAMEECFSDVDSHKQKRINALTQALSGCKEERDKAREERDEAKKVLSAMQRARNTAREERDAVKKALDVMQQARDAAQEERNEAKKALDVMQQARDAAQEERDAAKKALGAMQQARDAAWQERDAANEQLDAARLERDKLTYMLDQARKKDRKSQVQIREHKKVAAGWRKKYSTLTRSKLGRIQLAWWRLCGKIRKKAVKAKKNIRNFVMDHRPLAKLYMLLWGDRKYERQIMRDAPLALQTAQRKKESVQTWKTPDWALVPQAEFEQQTDKGFYQRIEPLLKDIPESNGGRYYRAYPVRIGIIADRFLYDSFRDAADFVFLQPDTWEEQISDIDMLLVVSAWRGLNKEWRGAAKPDSGVQQKIIHIIELCREKGLPTVFYSKEDPPNYELFLPLAKHCEYIFTSCAEVMDRYRAECGNEKVEALPFGIDPLYHNPVGMRNSHKQPGVIFSGSWMNKYPKRCVDMRLLMDGVLDSGLPLKIVDRCFKDSPVAYRYPPEYWANLSPAIDHDGLQKVHKLFNWALDINSVTDSLTMFANRGYELQAAGSLIISNYSVGVNDKLPFVFIANEKSEVKEILSNMEPEEIYRHQIDGIRAMMTGETCFDRVGRILEIVGLEHDQPVRRIAVVADADTPHIRELFRQQTYPEKTLLFEGAVTAEELSGYDMVAFFSDGMDYEIFYLEDMSNGFKYTACGYVTKAAYFEGGEMKAGPEHDYVDRMASKYRTLFWREDFDPQTLLDMDGEQELPNGYSIDHFNFNACTPRKKALPDGLRLSVIVPVYNNGRFLMAKCFASLQRSTMFHQMHIFLVDDGSTDGQTPDIVRYLERTYPNVTAYLFEDGGSGSASRPRNKGVELADTEYITFLDPDNEAVNDAYAAMYAMLDEAPDETPYDVVIGNMIKCTDHEDLAQYYQRIGCPKRGSDVYGGDMRQLLMKSNLLAMSIQAMLIRREMIVENHLEQVPGAAGQDTLFGWEIVAHARLIRATPLPVHIYYAMTSNSVTNSIGKRYFEKLRLIEGPRRKFLQQFDLLQFYAEHRYNTYFTDWVLKRLCRAKTEDEEECAQIVYEMHKMYLDCYDGKNQIINEFVKCCDAGRYDQALAVIRQARQAGRP